MYKNINNGKSIQREYILIDAQHYEKREQFLSEVLNEGKHKPWAYFQLGLIERSKNKDHSKALVYFDKALFIEPNLFYALFQKSISLRFLGKTEESVMIFNNLLEKYPDNESVATQLALSQQAHKNIVQPRTKALIISGCTNRAYAGYLKTAFPDWDVRFVFQSLAKEYLESGDKEFETYLSNLDIAVGFTDREPFTSVLPQQTLRVKLPHFEFLGYHPDVVFVDGATSIIENGNAHSKIAISAFFSGKSYQEAEALFNYDEYKKLGYFDHFEEQRDKLLSTYSKDGIDISDLFETWTEEGDFVHYPVHPNARIFFDVLHQALTNLGYKSALNSEQLAEARIGFDDYFKKSVLWPIYPEIASEFGIKVDAMNWRTCLVLGRGETLGLKEMLRRSWVIFEQAPEIFEDYANIN